jgi:lysophospholipase L1-like esterase
MPGELAPQRRRRFALLAAALSVAVVFGGAELLVRLVGRYHTPDTLRAHSLRYLPSIFGRHRLAPDQEVAADDVWGTPGTSPARRVFRINGQGYRGLALPAAKGPGEIRVVVLGGSSVFDLHATEGQDWPSLIADRLRHAGHRNVTVLNAGVPGHASFDSLARLYAQIWTYAPDFVLLYHGWNDLKYFTDVAPGTPLIALYRPYDPAADPFQHYANPLDRLLCSSQLYVKARTRYLMRRHRPGLEGAARGGPPRHGFDPQALAQFRLLTALLVDAAREAGATPVLVTEATLLGPHNDEQDRARVQYGYQRMDHDTLVRAAAAAADVIREVARVKDAPLLDLAAMLNGRRELFADQVHTTAAGSAALADAVASFLAPRLAADAAAAPATADR